MGIKILMLSSLEWQNIPKTVLSKLLADCKLLFSCNCYNIATQLFAFGQDSECFNIAVLTPNSALMTRKSNSYRRIKWILYHTITHLEPVTFNNNMWGKHSLLTRNNLFQPLAVVEFMLSAKMLTSNRKRVNTVSSILAEDIHQHGLFARHCIISSQSASLR